jgi:ferredoxin
MHLKPSVDPDTCTACGLCADSCPEVFRMGAASAEAFADPVPADQEECARRAAEECPVEAISVS